MNKLVKFYAALLTGLDMVSDENTDELSFNFDGKTVPAKLNINDKSNRLVALTPRVQKTGISADENKVIFHPLSESPYAKKAPPVHAWLQRSLEIRLNSLFCKAMYQMAHAACDTKKQGKMGATEASLFKKINAGDEKTVAAVHEIIDAIQPCHATQSFVHLRLKRGGAIGGKQYKFVCYVTFPILAELDNLEQDGTLFGVKLRKRDYPVITAMIRENLFRGLGRDVADCSGIGELNEAPIMVSILKAYASVVEKMLNPIAEQYTVTMAGTPIQSDLSWMKFLSDIPAMLPMVPPLRGNIGTENDPDDEEMPAAPRREVASHVNSHLRNPLAALADSDEDVATPHHTSHRSPIETHENKVIDYLQTNPVAGGVDASAYRAFDPLARVNAPQADTNNMSPEDFAVHRSQKAMQRNYMAGMAPVMPPAMPYGQPAYAYGAPGYPAPPAPMGYPTPVMIPQGYGYASNPNVPPWDPAPQVPLRPWEQPAMPMVGYPQGTPQQAPLRPGQSRWSALMG